MTTEPGTQAPTTPDRRDPGTRGEELRRVVFGSVVGTALEWYDFFIYGTAAALVFGTLFFPEGNEGAGTLLAFATFGVGFMFRPLGGIALRPHRRPDRTSGHPGASPRRSWASRPG